MFTLAEIRLLIEGLETLELEYGSRPELAALIERLKEDRASLVAEVEAAR